MLKKINGLAASAVTLNVFNLFTEYFISTTIIYLLIVSILITYSTYGLILQKAISECVFLILIMACYLILNDDLLTLNFIGFNNFIVSDYLSYITKILICFFSAIYFLMISNVLQEQKLTSFEYLLMILFAVLGLLLMCSSNDLLTIYLSIELSSLSLYILASFKKNSSYSIESGLKYFITGALSSAFFLLGSSFIYLNFGSIYCDDFFFFLENLKSMDAKTKVFYSDLYNLVKVLQMYEPEVPYYPERYNFFNYKEELIELNLIELGLLFIIFSLFIKLACAPFHLWSLDVYQGSPTSSSFFFAVITKLSIFVLLIRLCCLNMYTFLYSCHYYCFWVGILSIFIGSFGGLKEKKLKALLAYSSITSMGYGLLSLGTYTSIGIQSLFVHLIIYMLSGLCIWSIISFLRLKIKIFKNIVHVKELSHLRLLRKSNTALTFAILITIFSIAGIPPMIGFLAKVGVFLSIIQQHYIYFAIISAVLSVITTFYYIRIIKILYFENFLVGKLYYPLNTQKTLILSILIISLLLLFIDPSLLYLFSYIIIPQSIKILN